MICMNAEYLLDMQCAMSNFEVSLARTTFTLFFVLPTYLGTLLK